MAGSRLKRKKADRIAKQVAQEAEKRRRHKTVLRSVIYQLLLWGCWISIYLGWIPHDEPSQFIRLAVLTMPIIIYIAPLLFCVITDLIFDWIRDWAWFLVVNLWAACFLSVLIGKERSVGDYFKVYPATRLKTTNNGNTIYICTSEGVQLWVGFMEAIIRAHRNNKSWAGTFSLEHLRLTGHRCRINTRPKFSASFDNLLLDFSKLAQLLIKHYKGDGKKAETYMQRLYCTMTTPPVSANSSAVDQERFLKFLGKHLAFKSPRQKRIYILDLFKILRAMGSTEKAAFDKALSKVNVKDWRNSARRSLLLQQTFYYPRGKTYGPGLEELFRFMRNFFEHGGDADAQRQQRIQSLEDIDCAGSDIFPSFIIKLTYQLIMLSDLGGLLDYAWKNLE